MQEAGRRGAGSAGVCPELVRWAHPTCPCGRPVPVMRRSSTEGGGEASLGRRDVLGHRHTLGETGGLVVGPVLVDVERHQQAHDDLAVLTGGDVPGRERPAVSTRSTCRMVGRSASPPAGSSRATSGCGGRRARWARGAGGLRRDLTAEEPRPTDVTARVESAEDVAVELLEVEHLQQLVDVTRTRFTQIDRIRRVVHVGNRRPARDASWRPRHTPRRSGATTSRRRGSCRRLVGGGTSSAGLRSKKPTGRAGSRCTRPASPASPRAARSG